MSSTTDLVFCIENTSSITSYYEQIRETILSISLRALALDGDGVHISIIKYRSGGNLIRIIEYGFTQDINEIMQWLNDDQLDGGSQDGYEDVGNVLNAAFQTNWSSEASKKLVILITDGAPSGLLTDLNGADPWKMSKKFMEQDITLVVIGVGESIIVCDDFYCALAENTGGIYIPMINFQRIFLQAIECLFDEGVTFHEAFWLIPIEDIEINSSFEYLTKIDRVEDMMNKCETMNDIRRYF